MKEQQFYDSLSQHTINRSISLIGVGLHSGAKASIVIKPADENVGIYFIRKDVAAGTGLIPARWYNVSQTDYCTTLSNEHGVSVSTIEHLMAALRACGVDNAIIEVEGPEVPIMDGSAAPFFDLIKNTGIRKQAAPRNVIWIHRPIEYREGDNYVIVMPESRSRITAQIEFENTLIETQAVTFDLLNDDFSTIADCRTFGFAKDIPMLKSLGLIKGATLSNSVLVDGQQIVNEEGLRHKDEFVKHKVLDCVGDLALVGYPILGHYYAKRPGHRVNHQFLKKLFNHRDAWSYITLEEYYRLFGIYPDIGEARAKQSMRNNKNIDQGGDLNQEIH
jgi:UDP-3-O-[3-hydroxymyristoyl] N-acetylglucosamine deacetylase